MSSAVKWTAKDVTLMKEMLYSSWAQASLYYKPEVVAEGLRRHRLQMLANAARAKSQDDRIYARLLAKLGKLPLPVEVVEFNPATARF